MTRADAILQVDFNSHDKLRKQNGAGGCKTGNEQQYPRIVLLYAILNDHCQTL